MDFDSIKQLFVNLKVAVLTILVLAAFIFSSIGHVSIEANGSTKIIVAATILVFMYILMIFELVNRNLAALIGAALAIAAHDCIVELVEMEEILQWEDLETLSLLFGMMIIVNVLGDSGVFDYLAVWSYDKANGRFWLLITIMSFLTGFLSAFMDNVSTMLLMSPTLIKLSELEQIDPRYILMLMVVFSNIGGCATPVGDPPNLIIIGDPLVSSIGITFSSFTAYCVPCVLLCMFAILLYVKLVYKSKESFRFDPSDRRASTFDDGELSDYGLDRRQSDRRRMSRRISEFNAVSELKEQLTELSGNLTQDTIKIKQQLVELTRQYGAVIEQLRRTDNRHSSSEVGNKPELSTEAGGDIEKLKHLHRIKNKALLMQSLVVLVVAVILFFVQSIPGVNLTLGWVSLFAGLTLLVLSSSTKINRADKEGHEMDNFESVISRIEWSTLVFFFALFIVMKVMSKLGLIYYLGSRIGGLVTQIPSGQLRSMGAITIIIWSSGIASACIDNVPFTSMMIKVIGTLYIHARDADPGSLRLEPLVFALAFGACLGGNGTLIGASANLVTAGIAGRQGYTISFNNFFKFTSIITAITLVIANIYLIVVFVVLEL